MTPKLSLVTNEALGKKELKIFEVFQPFTVIY